ncbi:MULTISPECIES: Zn-dependent hydrolase [unclassified Paenibacillus]|uniref:Zn-dependent hydrolase n=1 Tax=unclassified Paenibacillus TaxID=185978 RepID=UPI00240532D7|nr:MULTISPECIES: Zn-dependent hydrolase [unclassified Paenibacillus]MDF9844510.1 allantoate deiminase [Paenibacillus sp. PastF-2]MDF9851114.1 allantoate deiminase [Paenibacillus sp. PastM-2]MDF9857686.1 allantoate deiminase [Paenibacillus sp. PastF-1]MDH6482952.1 allantoate deiminase [Paenibacillus sp. PastH-2]MDH6510377.1 allantoate deiminase [Paenibacillus sp. PastM-3]
MINAERLAERIETLGNIGRTLDGGVTRIALSEEDRQAQAVVSAWMEQAGMTVHLDPAGNLIGRVEGMDKTAHPVVIGSHIDSVVNGGKYDGTIGVLGGIEVVQHLKEEGILTMRPIEVIAFCEEEGSRFQSGLFGSRAMIGATTEEELGLKDKQGITRSEALARMGLDPGKIKAEAVRAQSDIRVYLEMHIEQGPVLEKMKAPVGIVTDIAGPSWMEVVVQGKAGHAGTLPMEMRQDAFLGASEIALLVERVCLSYKGKPVVGTVGHVEVKPGGSNIVPGRVVFSVDIRDVDEARRDEVIRQVKEGAAGICEQRGLQVSFRERLNVQPVQCTPAIVDVMKEQSKAMQLECPELVSGAGHDAQLIASISDMGMIFVRCKNGISHNPEEFAETADIALGTELLSRVTLHYAMQ